jgi:hypothetical protein
MIFLIENRKQNLKKHLPEAQREHVNNIRSKSIWKESANERRNIKAKLAKTVGNKISSKYGEYAVHNAGKQIETPKPPEGKKCY